MKKKSAKFADALKRFADAAGELMAHSECSTFLYNKLEALKADALNEAQSAEMSDEEQTAYNSDLLRALLSYA